MDSIGEYVSLVVENCRFPNDASVENRLSNERATGIFVDDDESWPLGEWLAPWFRDELKNTNRGDERWKFEIGDISWFVNN